MTKFLKDLPVGSLVVDKESTYKGNPIIWKIADKNHKGYPVNTVTLISNYILCEKSFDAKEPRNGSDAIRINGNNNYKLSNILQWLNSDQTSWYKAQHSADAPPVKANVLRNPYDTESGFLTGFADDFKEAMIGTSVKSGNTNVSSKMFLPSHTEVGLAVSGASTEGVKLPIFSSDASRKATLAGSSKSLTWWSRTPGQVMDSRVWTIDDSGEMDLEAYEVYGVRPLCNLQDEVMVTDSPVNGKYEIIWNKPPTKPGSFTLPSKITSRTATTISWSKSTDPEGDPISYRLERSLDGGAFVQRYKGSLASYKDTIEEKGHTSVVYRVTAIDSNGNQSPSLTSASVPVSDNTAPIITVQSTDLGKIDSPPTINFSVSDPDEGQAVVVYVYLDGKELDTFNFIGKTNKRVTIKADLWLRLLNGKHSVKIVTEDLEGGSSSKTISFEKAVTKIGFELEKSALQGVDKMPGKGDPFYGGIYTSRGKCKDRDHKQWLGY